MKKSKRLMVGVILGGLLFCTGQQVYAQNSDFTLRRLPASMGNQFVNARGQHRMFLPVSVSNDGLVAGQRWTWTQDSSGRIQTIDNQAGYVYDLNTRQYVAKFIKGMVPTYVSNDYYFGYADKDNATTHWDTYRCPTSGFYQNPNNKTYSNPSCVRIDKDGSNDPNQAPAGTNILGGYMMVSSLFRPVYASANANSKNGSAVVLRFNHADSPQVTGDVLYYYRKNYPVIKTDANNQEVGGFLSSLMGRATDEGNLALLTAANGKDDFVFSYPPEKDEAGNPKPGTAKIAEVLFPVDGSNSGSNIVWHDMNWLDGSGNLVEAFKINHDLDILSSAGICNLSDIDGGCSQALPVDFTSLGQNINTDLGSAVRGFNRKRIIAACPNPSDVNNGDPNCDGDVFVYNIANNNIVNLKDSIQQKFAETVAPNETAYTLPGWDFPGEGDSGRSPIPMAERILVSPNQKYMVWVVKKANGKLARYSFVFN